ncbi:hypothetical protein [Thioalkalivibrio sp. ALE19]|uniref:hypothetical protein n=1 Tax=Thioalkalivibrio sp. ALE19 TaxID=1266909 RepID=UPI00048BEDA6|nr:hypothetical protein [Thioalkalivibrio sp. ALE19]
MAEANTNARALLDDLRPLLDDEKADIRPVLVAGGFSDKVANVITASGIDAAAIMSDKDVLTGPELRAILRAAITATQPATDALMNAETDAKENRLGQALGVGK